MPLSTPSGSLESYNGDADHFLHVLDCLFIPAIEASDLQPLPPIVAGSDVIHGEIIKNLASADLVLCDMSQLNPNVFFEFGIRTALNRPVALVTDQETVTIPFDTGIINYHRYNSSLQGWLIKSEIAKLSEHINKTLASEPDRNSLWKYFGIAQNGFLSTEKATTDDKLSLMMQKLDSMENALQGSRVDSNFGIPNVISTFGAAKAGLEDNRVGGARRARPLRLGEKLLAIRKRLGMTQTEMARALQLQDQNASRISHFELSMREPNTQTILRYAQLAGVHMESLIDDDMNLPEPSPLN